MKNKRLKWKWKKERSAKKKKKERKGLRIHLWIEMCGSSTGSEKTERKELFFFFFQFGDENNVKIYILLLLIYYSWISYWFCYFIIFSYVSDMGMIHIFVGIFPVTPYL